MGGLDRIAGITDRTREDIGGATGDHGEQRRRVRAVGAAAEQPVDHLVHRAVATMGDDQPGTVGSRSGGDGRSMPAMGRLDDLELDLAGQRVREHVAATCRRRGRLRIHNQDSAHDGSLRRHSGRAPHPRTEEANTTALRV